MKTVLLAQVNFPNENSFYKMKMLDARPAASVHTSLVRVKRPLGLLYITVNKLYMNRNCLYTVNKAIVHFDKILLKES